MVKNPPANAGDVRDVGSVPGWGRSPGGGHGSPLQCSRWRVPWTQEPGGPQPTGSQRVGHYRMDLTQSTHDYNWSIRVMVVEGSQ